MVARIRPLPRILRGDSDSARLRRACLDKLKEHERDGALPTSGRFIFYELAQDGVIAKHDPHHVKQPDSYVTQALTKLRQDGLVPWDWLTDESRQLHTWDYASDVRGYLVKATHWARIDCWAGKSPPLILCESRATAGVLEPIAAKYLCPIAATGGQCGGFLVTEIAPLLIGNDRRVLYIGDHEIGGPADSIEANTRRYLEEHADRDIDWTRVALTQDQVDADPRLTDLVITKHDNRNKPPREYQAVECEAVGQVTLQRMLREALDARLPEPLPRVLEREERQRRDALALLRQDKGGS